MAVALIASLLLSAGCNKDATWWDGQERNQPLMQRAADRADQGDVESAVRLYLQAIDNNPDAARAHLDLPLLYHDKDKDYVKAVYHYERYLELRPGTEKQEMIANRVRLAKQAFAGSLLRGEGASAVRITALEKENTELQQQVEALEKEVRKLRARRVLPDISPGPANVDRTQETPDTPPEPEIDGGGGEGAVRTYRVSSGDTLSGIALKVYGDRNRWRDIQKANQEILGDSSRLRVGQVLVIP